MQIKKINNDKLKVILNSNDLIQKNIDIDSFLSNSVESQNLFFEILDLAEEKFDFNIENNKAIVETISIDNNLFILTITKLKSNLKNTYSKKSNIYQFDNIDDILNLYIDNHEFLKNTSVFEFNHNFYLLINENNPSLEEILLEFSSPLKNNEFLKNILIEYGKKIK